MYFSWDQVHTQGSWVQEISSSNIYNSLIKLGLSFHFRILYMNSVHAQHQLQQWNWRVGYKPVSKHETPWAYSSLTILHIHIPITPIHQKLQWIKPVVRKLGNFRFITGWQKIKNSYLFCTATNQIQGCCNPLLQDWTCDHTTTFNINFFLFASPQKRHTGITTIQSKKCSMVNVGMYTQC
jgi:hypothetical protein